MVVDAQLVHALLAEQFPEFAGLPLRKVVPGGWDNQTYRLGDALSVRVPRDESYATQVQKEYEWLPRLRGHLPLPIADTIAVGRPSDRLPWHWAIRTWLPGEIVSAERVADLDQLAVDLAGFLKALQSVDATGGPTPGPHNTPRGGPVDVWDQPVRRAIDDLRADVPAHRATAIWQRALEAPFEGPPVWIPSAVNSYEIRMRA